RGARRSRRARRRSTAGTTPVRSAKPRRPRSRRRANSGREVQEYIELADDEVLIATVKGPKGSVDIFEVTLPSTGAIEVEYAVVFGDKRTSFPSMGEAHLLADELAGNE